MVTPECSQELTQTPHGLSPLVEFMTARLTNNSDFDSNDETDDEITMSSSKDETTDEEIITNSKDQLSEGIWEACRKKEKLEPYVT